MALALPSRDEIAAAYLDQLEYDPYPVQEEALLAWFTAEQGVLVCAPTGTGKTLIAEAALFEALHTGKVAYYTTPLIALTEQKFREMQERARQWGFKDTDVGLVTGNRRENPDARVLVVVAEILFNRLLHTEAFDFANVSVVVMDEFHSFADRERGIVWEFSLGLLPAHVRTLLLSATVGNSLEFITWLRRGHDRRVELIQSDQRKVPLTFQWVPDKLLIEQLAEMADGDESSRKTPALVFCFNREECWTVAEQVKGKKLLSEGQQAQLAEELKAYDWSEGAGPKLRQILMRGVGVHHAGVLPKYRRIVEELFQRKLLSVAVCTETLSAGINLPARSVVLPNILKGPPGDKKVVEASTAHQIFGRAGRPQFDSQGFVFVLAHEDDVKIDRWRQKYDQIPEDTKDPNLRKAKKALKRKMPTRRASQQYWTEKQFVKLRTSPPGKLYSKGPLPWRLLAYMLDASPEVQPVRELVGKRLMDAGRLEAGQRGLDRMLRTLWKAGYVELEPEPPKDSENADNATAAGPNGPATTTTTRTAVAATTLFGTVLPSQADGPAGRTDTEKPSPRPVYKAERAYPTPNLQKLLLFRGVNPLYGVYLINQLGIADNAERIQAMESVLELPGSVAHFVRVPGHDELPPGPLATTRLDESLLRLGLVSAEQLQATPDDEDKRRGMFDEAKPRVLTLAEKLRILFDYDFPGVGDLRTQPVWAAGELIEFRGDFNKYVTSKGLQKQEGIIFRHLLRFILLVGEFARCCPAEVPDQQWRAEMGELSNQLVDCCRRVDPTSTEKTLEQVEAEAEMGGALERIQ